MRYHKEAKGIEIFEEIQEALGTESSGKQRVVPRLTRLLADFQTRG